MTNHTGLEEGLGPLCSSSGRAANPRTASAAPLPQEKGLSSVGGGGGSLLPDWGLGPEAMDDADTGTGASIITRQY